MASRQIILNNGGVNGATISQVNNLIDNAFLDLSVDVKNFGAIGNGIADDFQAIQDTIDNHIGRAIVIGSTPSDTFVINRPLYIPSGSRIIQNGTVKIADGHTALLTANASIGDTVIQVANANQYYSVGQWLVITDDNQALRTGSAYKEGSRVGDGILIAAVSSSTITATTALKDNFTTAANAKVGHAQNIFICKNVNDVVIYGNGVLDGNRANQLYSIAESPTAIEESLSQSCCLTLDTCTNIRVFGIKAKNAMLHNFALRDCSDIHLMHLVADGCTDKNFLFIGVSKSHLHDLRALNSISEDGFIFYYGNTDITANQLYAYNNKRHGIGFANTDTNRRIHFSNITLESNVNEFYIQNCQDIDAVNVNIIGTAPTGAGAITTVAAKNISIKNISISRADTSAAVAAVTASENITIDGGSIRNMAAASSTALSAEGSNIKFLNLVIDTVVNVVKCNAASSNVRVERCHMANYSSLIHSASTAPTVPRFSGCTGILAAGSSTATIPSGQTYTTVYHGLTITPLIQNISISAASSLGSAKSYWVSDINPYGFAINVDQDPGVDISFNWIINDTYTGRVTAQLSHSSKYTSDFSAGTDSWTGNRVTVAGNVDSIGGKNDVLKSYADADTGTHVVQRTGSAQVGSINKLSFQYYIPSGQSNVSNIKVWVNGYALNILNTGVYTSPLGQWVTVVCNEWIETTGTIYIELMKGASTVSYSGAGSSSDDIVYFRDFKVEYRPAYQLKYASDFSTGANSWAPVRTVVSGNEDGVSGQDDVLKVYADDTLGSHLVQRTNTAQVGSVNRLSFDYLIPSGQTNVANLKVWANGYSLNILNTSPSTLGSWQSVVCTEWTETIGTIVIELIKGTGTNSFAGANSSSDDIIYFKNFTVEYR